MPVDYTVAEQIRNLTMFIVGGIISISTVIWILLRLAFLIGKILPKEKPDPPPMDGMVITHPPKKK